MDKQEKINALKKINPEVLKLNGTTQAFINTGDFKQNYMDYLKNTSAISIEDELQALDTADYETTCALFTMVLREALFCGENWFQKRVREGVFKKIIDRMITLLEAE